MSLRPTEAQLAYEELEAMPGDKALKERVARSNVLRGKLEKLLTDDQKKQLASGDFVGLKLGDMPSALQGEALDYLKFSAQQLAGTVPTPDYSKQHDFEIRFRPQSAGLYYFELGVTIYDGDGNLHQF